MLWLIVGGGVSLLWILFKFVCNKIVIVKYGFVEGLIECNFKWVDKLWDLGIWMSGEWFLLF